MKNSWLLIHAACLVIFVLIGCDKDSSTTSPPSPVISLCATSMSASQFTDMLNGNLAIVAGYSKDGWSTSEVLGGFIEGFVINTLDFHALEKWNVSFTTGKYHIRNGQNTLDLFLIADKNFGIYRTGDTLKENLFDPESYVRNIHLNLSGVTFDHGPLYGLVSGNISWNGTQPVIRLDATSLALRVISNGNWYFSWHNGPTDTLMARMTSSLLHLANFNNDFTSGRVGFSYDSTYYTSPSFKLQQWLFQSEFLMTPLDAQAKRWSWEGGYQSRMDKTSALTGKPLEVFINGHISTIKGNQSGYYCDADLQDSLGIAVFDSSGSWGYFKSIRGDSIAFGLIPAAK